MNYAELANSLITEILKEILIPNNRTFFFIPDILSTVSSLTSDEQDVILDFYHYLENHGMSRKGVKYDIENSGRKAAYTVHQGHQLTHLGKIVLHSETEKERMVTDFLVEYRYIKPINFEKDVSPGGPTS